MDDKNSRRTAAALWSWLMDAKPYLRGRPVWPLALWALAFSLRLLYFHEMRADPAFHLLVGDSQVYDAWGARIAAGEWVGRGVFYQAPLYPYFLGVLYATFGHSTVVVQIAQAFLGATSCVLLACAGSRFFGPGSGMLAGLALAYYPPAIFFDGLLQKSALDLFFTTLLLLLLAKNNRREKEGWFVTGLVLGGLMLTRENALVLVFGCLAWLVWRGHTDARRAGANAARLALGLTLVLLPVGARNLFVGGEFHLTTSQFGSNFYIGNNPSASGIYQPLRPGHGSATTESEDATNLAELALGRTLTPGEVSGYWLHKAQAFITAEPGRWAHLLARKALLVLNRVEISDTDDFYSAAEKAPVLGALAPVLHFGLLVPLAAAGIVLTWSNRDSRILAVFLALYAVSVVLFYVFARYRYPLVPALILLAAAGCTGIADAVRRRRRQLVAAAGGVAVFAAVVANWSIIPEQIVLARALGQNNIGATLWGRNRNLDEAAPYFRSAIRLYPRFAEPYFNLGLALLENRRPADALSSFRQATTIDPGYAEAHQGTGACLIDLNRPAEAADGFRAALALDPRLAPSHYGLGLSLKSLGFDREAETHLSEAARLDPRFRAQ